MNLKLPDICSIIHLSEYAPEFGEEVIHVWVNPTRAMLQDATRERDAGEVWQWYAEIWSHGPEGTHWTPEEVEEFAGAAMDRDPELWAWVTGETARLVLAHRKKKAVTSKDTR